MMNDQRQAQGGQNYYGGPVGPQEQDLNINIDR